MILPVCRNTIPGVGAESESGPRNRFVVLRLGEFTEDSEGTADITAEIAEITEHNCSLLPLLTLW